MVTMVLVTFLQMEYFYLLRFSGFVFICLFFFFHNNFNIIFPAFCLSPSGGVMSEESVQSWLNFCYYCCVSMWWGIGTGEWGSPQGQAVQGGGRKFLFPASASPSAGHVVSSPSALPLKPQHFAHKKAGEKDRREKNVLSEGLRRSVRSLVLKLYQDHSIPSIAAAAQWKIRLNKTSPDLLYMKTSRNFQLVLWPHSCLLLHGVFFSWCDPNLRAVGTMPGCAVTSSLVPSQVSCLHQQIPDSLEGNTCSR